VGVLELALDTQRVGLVADIERAARHVLILGADDGTDGLDGEVVGLQLVRVAIDLNLALRGTAD
jgi:hypothetical protein